MKQFKDYYSVLGISRVATLEEIKTTYKKLVKQYHPDINKTPEAEVKMKEINEAYDVLGDSEKKGRYDIVFNHYIVPQYAAIYYSGATNFQQTIDGNGFTVTWTIYS